MIRRRLILPLALALSATPAAATIEVVGRTLPVIDMHLHPGDYATMAPRAARRSSPRTCRRRSRCTRRRCSIA
jgi:hypothetical protein